MVFNEHFSAEMKRDLVNRLLGLKRHDYYFYNQSIILGSVLTNKIFGEDAVWGQPIVFITAFQILFEHHQSAWDKAMNANSINEIVDAFYDKYLKSLWDNSNDRFETYLQHIIGMADTIDYTGISTGKLYLICFEFEKEIWPEFSKVLSGENCDRVLTSNIRYKFN